MVVSFFGIGNPREVGGPGKRVSESLQYLIIAQSRESGVGANAAVARNIFI